MKENSEKYQGGSSRSRPALKPFAARKQLRSKHLLQEQWDVSLQPQTGSVDTEDQLQGLVGHRGWDCPRIWESCHNHEVPFTFLWLDAEQLQLPITIIIIRALS